MAIPALATFSSLSAKTDCFQFNWINNIAENRTITYLDCNGFSGRTQSAPVGQSGFFCGRSHSSVAGGGVGITNVGNCPCITYRVRTFNSADFRQYTYTWLDCNGQQATKTITIPQFSSSVIFYVCSNSQPVQTSSGGPHNLEITKEDFGGNYCRRNLVG